MHKNSQDNIPPPEGSNPIVIGPEKFNSVESSDNNFKIAIMNTFKDPKGDMNKCLNEDPENTNEQLNEMIKHFKS